MNTISIYNILDLCITLSALFLILFPLLPLLFKAAICIQKFPTKVKECKARKIQFRIEGAIEQEFHKLMSHKYDELRDYSKRLALPTLPDRKKPTLAMAIARHHVGYYGF